MSDEEYGKIYKRAWADRDFRALTESEQSLYLKLISQHDTTPTGEFVYDPNRWAAQSAGLSVAAVEDALNVLIEKGFVTIHPAAVTKTPGPRSTGRAAS